MKNVTPGWMTEEELAGIDAIADVIRPGSWVLEVGCFLGRSAIQWARHKNVERVICVDPWMGTPAQFGGAIDFCDERDRIHLDIGIYDQFIMNTHDQPKIYPVRYYGQEFVWIFPNKFPAVIFLDGDHSESGLRHDLARAITPHWGNVAGSGTIVAGHDYDHSHIPHMKPIIDEFAATNNLTVQVMGGMVFALNMPQIPAPNP